MKTWYIRNNNEHLGPYSIEELKLVGLYSDDFVWNESLHEWTRASTIEELNELITNLDAIPSKEETRTSAFFGSNSDAPKSNLNDFFTMISHSLSSLIKKKMI